MHLDNAEVYNTEPEMGVAIKESKIDRSKLFVTTKVQDINIRMIMPFDSSDFRSSPIYQIYPKLLMIA